MQEKRKNLLFCCSGSVASIKCTEIVKKLSLVFNVKVVLSDTAMHFVKMEELKETGVPFFTNKDEWDSWSKMGDPVLHIELSDWAEIVLVAPLSANSLAKFANGLSDNLLSCIIRALPFDKETKKVSVSVIVCPAMNTKMWEHPTTSEHIQKLKSWGFCIVDPIEKMLACNTHGKGAMENVDPIVEIVSKLK